MGDVVALRAAEREDETRYPHNYEAERAVLGALLLRPHAWQDVQDVLPVQHFYLPEHQTVYAAVLEVAKRGEAVDFLTVKAELERTGKTLTDIGGLSYLTRLTDGVPKATNVLHYAGIVSEKARLRALMDAGSAIARAAETEQGLSSDLLAEAEQRLRGLEAGAVRDRLLNGAQLAELVMERLSAAMANGGAVTGLATGFYDFDRLTTGLHPGELVILAGRPGMGKTSFAGALAWHAATSGVGTLFVSIEMTADDVALRLACLDARVCFTRARSGQLVDSDRHALMRATRKLEDSAIHIEDTARTVADVRRLARLVSARSGLGLVIIDYLQFMQPVRVPGRRHAENRVRELGEMTGELKSLGKELRVPIVLLAQVNRACEARSDKRPMLSDLRDSGEIEQDADLVCFLYLGEKYQDGPPGIGELIIAKQRNGPLAIVPLKWTGEWMRYDNLEQS